MCSGDGQSTVTVNIGTSDVFYVYGTNPGSCDINACDRSFGRVRGRHSGESRNRRVIA